MLNTRRLCSFSVAVCLSVLLSVCFAVCLAVCLSLSFSVSLPLSLFLSVSLSQPLSPSLSLSLFLPLSVSLSLYLFQSRSFSLPHSVSYPIFSISRTIYLSIYLPILLYSLGYSHQHKKKECSTIISQYSARSLFCCLLIINIDILLFQSSHIGTEEA